MDYESLFMQVPKEPKRWTFQDVAIWLEFIGLSNLKENFQLNSIDGSCLELIEEKELEEDLKVAPKIVRKKLMNWLTTGLREFSEYALKQKLTQQMMIEEPVVQLKKQMTYAEEIQGDKMALENLELTNEARGIYRNYSGDQNFNENQTNYFKPDHLPNQQQLHGATTQVQSQQFQQSFVVSDLNSASNEINSKSPLMQEEKKGQVQQQVQDEYLQQLEKLLQKTQNELIIQPTEGPQTNFYCIKEQGGKIGRHSSNQILILEESISRFHAEIVFSDGQFFLRDIGSTTGTFIKVESKVQLNVGMIIELGSNQFEVESIVLSLNSADVTLAIIEGPNSPDKHNIKLSALKRMVNMGRKPTAEINFPEDHHLSNIHSKLCLIDGRVYLEDMGSTNGSWLRLSKEGIQSNNYVLESDAIFKIGTTSTYTCKKQQQMLQERAADHCCIICCESDRDALYMPCKHNTACLKCSKSLKDCPICRTKIEDIIRIYKN